MLYSVIFSAIADKTDSGLYIEYSGKNIPVIKVAIARDAGPRVRDAARNAQRIIEKLSEKKVALVKLSGMPAKTNGTLFIGNIPGEADSISGKLKSLKYGYIVNKDKGSVQIVGTNPYYSYIGLFRFFQKLGANFYVRPDTLERYKKERKDLVETFPENKTMIVKSGWNEKPRFLNLDSGRYIAPVTGQGRSAASATHGMAPMLLPCRKYAKNHPEYYSRACKGKLADIRAHLCMSNPEVQRIAKENLIKWMDKYPKDVYFNLGHADSADWCTCENCKAMGASNERYFKFINILASEAIKKYPEKKLVAIAYTPFTEAPPENFKPAKNVTILFCPYFWGGAKSQSHGLDSDVNQVAMTHFKEWMKILAPGQMISFDYVRIYFISLYPDLMLDANIDNMKLYARYPQVETVIHCGWPAYSMADLEYYVLDRLMWEPQLDSEKLINDFMDAYYGKAAPFMKEYLTLLRKTVKKKPHYQSSPYYNPGLLDSGLAEKAYPIFARAEEAVKGSKKYLNRVLKEKAFLLYVDLFERNSANGKQPDLNVYASKLQEFLKIMLDVVNPERKAQSKSGKGMTSWGKAGRGQLAPHLWITQVSGMQIDGKDIYTSKTIREFLHSDDPAKFISRHSTPKRPVPAGNRIAIVKNGTSGKIWINNPYKAVLHLVGQGSGKLTVKFNGQVAFDGNPGFGKELSAKKIEIPIQVQKHGWNEISFIYRHDGPDKVLLKEARLLF